RPPARPPHLGDARAAPGRGGRQQGARAGAGARRRRPRALGSAGAPARCGRRTRPLRLRADRLAALLRAAHAERAARGRRGGDSGPADLPRPGRLRRAVPHHRERAKPLRPPRPARDYGGADLLSPHAARRGGARVAEAALPEGAGPDRGRLPREDRRGPVARPVDLRVRAGRPLGACAGGAGAGARGALAGRLARMSVEQRAGGNSETPGGGAVSTADVPVLGSDPFADPGGPDPLDAWLDALDQLAARGHAPDEEPSGGERAEPSPREEPVRTPIEEATAPAVEPTPQVGDAELPAEFRRLGRLVGEGPARRLAALIGRLEGYDRFGLSRTALQQAFPIFYALYRLYFRVQSSGHEHLPEGPALLVANHGGLLPFDGAMAVLDVLLHTDPPRLPRAIVDRWAGSLPFVNVFFARVGQVVGTHENLARLLSDGEAVL